MICKVLPVNGSPTGVRRILKKAMHTPKKKEYTLLGYKYMGSNLSLLSPRGISFLQLFLTRGKNPVIFILWKMENHSTKAIDDRSLISLYHISECVSASVSKQYSGVDNLFKKQTKQ